MDPEIERQIAALEQAIGILQDRLAELRRGRRPTVPPEPTISGLPISARMRNCLLNLGDRVDGVEPTMLRQVARWPMAEFLRTPHFGMTSYIQIWELCVEHGLWLVDDKTHRPPEKWLNRYRKMEARRVDRLL